MLPGASWCFLGAAGRPRSAFGLPRHGLPVPTPTLTAMANFITGTHHCPDCSAEHVRSWAFEQTEGGDARTDWCAFACPAGHVWARPGQQAAK